MTPSYQAALKLIDSLSSDEQLRLSRELTLRAAQGAKPEPTHSIMELRGLGKEVWNGIDAQDYVDRERASWIG